MDEPNASEVDEPAQHAAGTWDPLHPEDTDAALDSDANGGGDASADTDLSALPPEQDGATFRRACDTPGYTFVAPEASSVPIFSFRVGGVERIVKTNVVDLNSGRIHPVFVASLDAGGAVTCTLDPDRPFLIDWIPDLLDEPGVLFSADAVDLDADGEQDLVLASGGAYPSHSDVAFPNVFRWDTMLGVFVPARVDTPGVDHVTLFQRSYVCWVADLPAGASYFGDGALDITCSSATPQGLSPRNQSWVLQNKLQQNRAVPPGPTTPEFLVDYAHDSERSTAFIPNWSGVNGWGIAFFSDDPIHAPNKYFIEYGVNPTPTDEPGADGIYRFNANIGRYEAWSFAKLVPGAYVMTTPACQGSTSGLAGCDDPMGFFWTWLDGKPSFGLMPERRDVQHFVASWNGSSFEEVTAAHDLRQLHLPSTTAGEPDVVYAGWGAGTGDFNLDGCPDIVVSTGLYEAPPGAALPSPVIYYGQCVVMQGVQVVYAHTAHPILDDRATRIQAPSWSVQNVALQFADARVADVLMLGGDGRTAGSVVQVMPRHGHDLVAIDVVGDPALRTNSAGIGTVVECLSGDLVQSKWVVGSGGSGPGGTNLSDVFCAYDPAQPLDGVRVTWVTPEPHGAHTDTVAVGAGDLGHVRTIRQVAVP